jgi:hypothetical protein
MLTQTGTITVNAAFLQDLKDDNIHLQRLLAALHGALSPPLGRRIRPANLADLLGRLRDQLATHFSLEEFFGYFDDALDVAPRFSARADVLVAQHATLFEEICEIVEEAERLAYHESSGSGIQIVAERYHAFHQRLESHESCENELIMDALNEDIGEGD